MEGQVVLLPEAEISRLGGEVQMTRRILRWSLCAIVSVAALASVSTAIAQPAPEPRSTISQALTPPAFPQSRVDESLIEFPLAKTSAAYADIDGRKLHRYVEDLAQISRRYRDACHPQFWGRIIGSSADHETNDWLAGKFRALGLSDVRIQPLDLPPQWYAKSWSVTLTSAGRTAPLTSAQPVYEASGISPGREFDAVYVGLGTEVDFAGKDVRGKAVFFYGMLGLPDQQAAKRASDKGAAVVFEVSMLPGNMHFEGYPSAAKTAFTLGNDDGKVVRDMMEAAQDGRPVKVNVRLDVEKIPNLQTALVWGVLPGVTDETIYVTAHKDGWFEAASDNAGGVASMLGLAEHFAKIPQSERRRTIVFIGLDGHHNSSRAGAIYLTKNRAPLFSKTALLINDEHPSTITTQSRPRYYPGDEIAWANTYMPLQWYAGGEDRPEMNRIAWNAFREFGVPVEMDASPVPPASDASFFYGFVNALDASEYHNYFHTDWETPEVVPWTGLQASTRAFARIIDEVNKAPLSTFKRPEDVKSIRYPDD
jgi:hypothetical protein